MSRSLSHSRFGFSVFRAVQSCSRQRQKPQNELDIDNIFISRFILGSDPDESLSCVAKKETTSDAKTNRIVGGGLANFAPYQIWFGFIMKANNTLGGGCGGTILNKRYILTARHCLGRSKGTMVSPKTAIIKVVVGELNWCNAIGLDGDTPPRNFSLLLPKFQEKIESVKDVSEVFIYHDADLAILKVAPSFVMICIKL